MYNNGQVKKSTIQMNWSKGAVIKTPIFSKIKKGRMQNEKLPKYKQRGRLSNGNLPHACCRTSLAVLSDHKIMKKLLRDISNKLSILSDDNHPLRPHVHSILAPGYFKSPLIFELDEISATVFRRSFGISFTPPRQVS
ncbi:hypothetical protein ALC56_08728 [Trachymyrmex septentrionalis]|uniref:Uncharacterized protein n=1 Tax=Trachymyrmex septentrionalis TaxID=34720 RepID=A0A195F9P9_9HYME|nr:hypothetical protein ALC56_08728 [Trachymyrmex septentrionalis]